MLATYKIFEKFPDGTLAFVEKAENLERAKVRFLSLSAASSQREYLIWDATRGYEVVLRAAATS